MAQYQGLVKFVSSNKMHAIVRQTKTGSSYSDGHKHLKGNFTSILRNQLINYDYKKDLHTSYETEYEVVLS